MGGGLLQLVAYGAQDLSLTGNPQITFFNSVFRRHTNFAIQTIEQTLDGSFKSNGRISFNISRDGDLLSDLVLKTDGPTSDSFSFFDYIDCEIGGQLIDRQYNHWMNVWCDLTHNKDKTKLLNDLRTGISENEPAYVPLQFWFCKNAGLSIPLLSLQYHEVKFNIKLSDDLSNINNIEIYGDYIFLDNDERRRFAQGSHEYLIEQVQYSNRQHLSSVKVDNNISQEVISITELQFNHPVKELIWTIEQVTDSANSSTKACSVENLGGNQNIIVDSSLIQMNGQDRTEKRDGKYYSQIQRYQRHSGAGLRNTRIGVGSDDITSDLVITKWYPKATNAHVYSFALNPEEHQPSGTCNFSRLDNATLQNTISTSSINGNYKYFIDVYAINYNVLRITSGMGGLVYSN
tara:strand:+ start:943 stop:2154 length:1212 start_codon:yes stop_codon:yes gene_type:complete